MVLTKTHLQQWNSLNKDWYSIYQWGGTSSVRYTEWVAEWIVESFEDIQLEIKGLREKGFKVIDHRGQAKLSTGMGQFTEKRFVRAIFNLGQIPFLLGKIIDYEIPLKATQDDKHGDIDILCLAPDAIVCVEAKDPRGSTSILKAIVQSFVYTSRAGIRHKQFVEEFKLPTTLPFTPAILIGRQDSLQLQQLSRYPHLSQLVGKLNEELAKSGAGAIRFFMIENDKSEFASCLTTVEQPNGDKKIIFADGFTPQVFEWPKSS
ncbi:MAG TPA: hypothetical protein VFN62_12915 [Acidobacteriaceae bacterium]|nr:hypothetical protein [Acidobacteriaceae bacterium]